MTTATLTGPRLSALPRCARRVAPRAADPDRGDLPASAVVGAGKAEGEMRIGEGL